MASEVTQLDMDDDITFEELHRMLEASRSPFHRYCAFLLTECLAACDGDRQQVRRFLETHDLRDMKTTTEPLSNFTRYDKEYRDKVAATLLACFEDYR